MYSKVKTTNGVYDDGGQVYDERSQQLQSVRRWLYVLRNSAYLYRVNWKRGPSRSGMSIRSWIKSRDGLYELVLLLLQPDCRLICATSLFATACWWSRVTWTCVVSVQARLSCRVLFIRCVCFRREANDGGAIVAGGDSELEAGIDDVTRSTSSIWSIVRTVTMSSDPTACRLWGIAQHVCVCMFVYVMPPLVGQGLLLLFNISATFIENENVCVRCLRVRVRPARKRSRQGKPFGHVILFSTAVHGVCVKRHQHCS